MSVEAIRQAREAQEAAARAVAKTLTPGDYYADGNEVRERGRRVVHVAPSHWDACLVMLYADTPDAYGRTGEMEDCMPCGGSGLEYGETCVTCGGFGWTRLPQPNVSAEGG